MTLTSEALECVAFMLIADNQILVEKRSVTKKLLPGILAIPGGHLEEGEDLESALLRELREELNITPHSFSYICTMLHHAEEFRKIYYFVVESWQGEVSALEAESLQWISLEDVNLLDLEIDLLAIQRYQGSYHSMASYRDRSSFSTL